VKILSSEGFPALPGFLMLECVAVTKESDPLNGLTESRRKMTGLLPSFCCCGYQEFDTFLENEAQHIVGSS
jgi:hypothetical protein